MHRADPPDAPAAALAELRAVAADAGEVSVAALAPGVACIRIPLPYPNVPSVNSYVLDQGDGIALVDCGTSLGLGWEAIEAGLARLGRDPGQIRSLVLTHTHSDHAGLAAELVERTGCRLYRGAGPETRLDALREVRQPRAERRRRGAAEGIPRRLLPEYVGPVIAEDCRHAAPPPDRLLADGDPVPGLEGWRAVAAPGHSPNQICLLGEAGALISADLVLPVAQPYLEWGHSPDPWSEYDEALRRVAALEPRLLLPGHGAAVAAPERAIAKTRARIDRLLGEVEAALDGGRESAFEVSVALAGPEAGLDQRQSRLAIALAVLEHLQRVGLATAATGADGVRRFRPSRDH